MINPRFRTNCLALLLAAPLMGCGAKGSDIKVGSVEVSSLAGWKSECVGRWWVNLPEPIDVGASTVVLEASKFTPRKYPEFRNFTPLALKDFTRSRGKVFIGPVGFSESVPMGALEVPKDYWWRKSGDAATPFDVITSLADGYAYRWVGYPASEQKPVDIHYTPNSIAWATNGMFMVSKLLPGDDRARIFWKDIDQVPRPEHFSEAEKNPPMPPDQLPLAQEVMNKLWPRYSPRKPGQSPQGPGICTPHGFFADPTDSTERDTGVGISFVDPRFANLALHVEISTRMPHLETGLIPSEDIRQAMTPWEAAEEIAKENKKRCRPQQGTSSRDILGCSLAGATGIDSHWDVQYIKLANGQEARVMTVIYIGAFNDYKEYEVIVETAGKRGSVKEPRIVVTAEGYGSLSKEPPFTGKKPPPVEDAFKLAVAVAKSLRPREEAVDPQKPVADTWVKFRP